MNIKKGLLIVLGCMNLVLGAVGVILPLLPAFPFLLLAAICFGKSSKKLHHWFTGTKLYRNNLESYIKHQGLTPRAKIKIMITVTLLMSFGLFMMLRRNLYVPCIILGIVWLFHVLYFSFRVKTIRQKELE